MSSSRQGQWCRVYVLLFMLSGTSCRTSSRVVCDMGRHNANMTSLKWMIWHQLAYIKKFRILERVECKTSVVSRKFTFDTSTRYVCVQLYGIYVSISLSCRNELICWACLTDLNWPYPSPILRGNLMMRTPSGTGLLMSTTWNEKITAQNLTAILSSYVAHLAVGCAPAMHDATSRQPSSPTSGQWNYALAASW